MENEDFVKISLFSLRNILWSLLKWWEFVDNFIVIWGIYFIFDIFLYYIMFNFVLYVILIFLYV